ncbi:hypothetical protein H0A61_00299 [Koleobacter methoxysyntrophicus]|uniref:CRISPR type III-associated protein domain-containing protein n=1 Tax=Koleobacter methoxysyntrophicus TaxID=2751313 RepID=A0A8A0RK16_9FIRM|nr:RAMP superfamily CRISPR-associated protein [Koleobacter methoxysyntrophicus]QSQ07980.1 hypothetical protein H0A61_00299 [Koleobacter methoxysyntrophicus]
MYYEVIREDLKGDNDAFHFLKNAMKYALNEEKIEDKAEIPKLFPFIADSYINTKMKVKEIPLTWFKDQHKRNWEINNTNGDLQRICNIFDDVDKFKNYTKTLIPGSFGIWCKFKLLLPYFSRDDDDFYIIDNPVLKDKVWKAPMVRGSTWKGALLNAASLKLKELIEDENKPVEKILGLYVKISRIFGTGSNEFREVENSIEKALKDEKKSSHFIKSLMKYALSELGCSLYIERNGESLTAQIWKHIKEEVSFPKECFRTRRGRAVFYPTFFDTLSLEVINPHNRKTKAGTQPIYFEVVPKDTEGIFQLVYIPYDSVMMARKEVKQQMKDDCKLLKELTRAVLEQNGIGAKTKLGWGTAQITQGIESFSNMGEIK